MTPMEKNQIVAAWSRFAEQLIQEECPGAEVDCSEFGRLMAKVVAKHGAAESVLWAEETPCGTEDRTWVRAWLQTKSVKGYENVTRSLDAAHAARCIQAFDSELLSR